MQAASATYNKISNEEAITDSLRELGHQDPRRDLAVVIALSLLQSAGLAKRKLENEYQPSLQLVNRSLFLQGVLVLRHPA